MNAREFLLTDPKIEEAVSNGYDIRLEEHEWIEKMEQYAAISPKQTKQNEHIHYFAHCGPWEKCVLCNQINEIK